MKQKFFGTDGIRGLVGDPPITPDLILHLGWAIGKALKLKNNHRVLIGKDTRISGYMLESALEAGLAAAGVNVGLLGPMPTPAVSFLTSSLGAQAGIVISASHNPYHDNGIKIFDHNGNKLSNKLEIAIEQYMDKPLSIVDNKYLGKAKRVLEAEEQYINFCKKIFPKNLNLKKFKIVIDCANGANYKIAPKIFAELGATIETLSTAPDGLNINVNCGSTNPKLLVKKVKYCKADLGIALDGDGDRVILVDSNGKIVDGDDVLFIIANLYLSTGKKLQGVIGTIMSNLGLEKALDRLGLSFVRTSVGDKHIFEELIKRRWQLGGESSGHIICRNIHSTGDGIIAALKVLEAMIVMNKSLSELLAPMEKYPQVLINIPVKKSLKYNKLLNNFNFRKAYKFLEQKLKNDGRVIIRPSGTEPVMRLMVEGSDKKLINLVAKELQQVILNVV